jgi:hypothetical protein
VAVDQLARHSLRQEGMVAQELTGHPRFKREHQRVPGPDAQHDRDNAELLASPQVVEHQALNQDGFPRTW